MNSPELFSLKTTARRLLVGKTGEPDCCRRGLGRGGLRVDEGDGRHDLGERRWAKNEEKEFGREIKLSDRLPCLGLVTVRSLRACFSGGGITSAIGRTCAAPRNEAPGGLCLLWCCSLVVNRAGEIPCQGGRLPSFELLVTATRVGAGQGKGRAEASVLGRLQVS